MDVLVYNDFGKRLVCKSKRLILSSRFNYIVIDVGGLDISLFVAIKEA